MEQSDGDGEKDVGRREGEQVRIPLPPLRCIFPCLRGIFFLLWATCMVRMVLFIFFLWVLSWDHVFS